MVTLSSNLCIIFVSFFSLRSSCDELKLVLFYPTFLISRPEIDSALQLAKNDLYENGFVPNSTVLSIRYIPTYCSPTASPAAIISQLFYEGNVNAVLGPYCSGGLAVASQLASYLNLPIIGYLSVEPFLVDKQVYSTLARVSMTADRVGDAVRLVLKRYGWRRVGLIHQGHSHGTARAAQGIVRTLEAAGISINVRIESGKNGTVDDDMLGQLRDNARVIVCIFSTFHFTGQLMLDAQRLGMTTPEFVYILPWFVGGTSQGPYPWDTEETKRAFRSALLVGLG